MAMSYKGQEENHREPEQFEIWKETDMEAKDNYKELQSLLNKNKWTSFSFLEWNWKWKADAVNKKAGSPARKIKQKLPKTL